MSTTRTTFRMACYGFVDRAGGSISSAGFAIAQELLKRGHEIDFFGNKGFVYPRELEAFPNFKFIDTQSDAEDRLHSAFAKLPTRVLRAMTGGLRHRLGSARLIRLMRQAHRDRRYDLQLFLGTWAFGRIPNVPVISWVQGAPGTDGRSIARHARQIVEHCGRKEYLMLRAYAWYREHFGLPPFRHSDVVICGSTWSKSALVGYGVSAEAIHAVAYPVDLDLFSPEPSAARQANATLSILWLGRVVPRKRLDLFLGACEQLLESGMKIEARVVGGFAFAGGFRALLSRFRFPEALKYSERVDRASVPDLVRAAAIVLQPSEEEDFGSAVAEALACGTPVVVGSTNGTADYCGGAAEVFAEYSVNAVASALRTMLARVDAQRSGLAATARSTAEAHFHVSRVVDRWEEIFAEATRDRSLNEGAGGSPHPARSLGSSNGLEPVRV